MRRAAACLGLTLGALLPACVPAPAPRPEAGPAAALPSAGHHVEDAPRELQPALARAEAAIRTFRERLAARRAAELASSGIPGASRVCRTEVRAIAAAVSAQTGVELGRAGARPREGERAAPRWIAPFVAKAPRRAADFHAVVVDLGDRVGLLRPIALTSSCLSCHGPAERVAAEVKAAADGPPGSDGAAGSSEGDLRGYFWAEAPKATQ